MKCSLALPLRWRVHCAGLSGAPGSARRGVGSVFYGDEVKQAPAKIIYRVKRWNDLFESAKSRTYNARNQVYMPNKHGLGYRRIISDSEGEAVFGCWCATVQVLSRQQLPRHGYLTDTGTAKGCPLSSSDLSLMTGYKIATCDKMVELCSSSPVAWLERQSTCNAHGYRTDTAVFSPPVSEGEGKGEGKGEGEGERIAQFKEAWDLYPDKTGRHKAEIAYWKSRQAGTTHEEIMDGLRRYIAYVRSRQASDFKYLKFKNGGTWFFNHCWLDEYTLAKKQNNESFREELIKPLVQS